MEFRRLNPVPLGRRRTEGHQRILYVEDEDTNWEVAQLWLRDKFNLTRAKNDREVFELLGKEKFDLILMDIQLSGSTLNGVDITKILRGGGIAQAPLFAQNIDCDNARIIFVTAYSARYSRSELVQAGGDEMLAKPVNFRRLSVAISKLLVSDALEQLEVTEQQLREREEPQKRRHMRVPLQLSCDLEIGGENFLGRLVDLSLGGARFRIVGDVDGSVIERGASAEIRFATAWGMVKGPCEIAWVSAGSRKEAGLEFGNLGAAAKMILEKWLLSDKGLSN
jgi:CheY-like chemotaxis protein